MKEIESCGVGGDREFESLWTLPALPLTERAGKYRADHGLVFDQELLISTRSGHVQLRYQVPPSILYTKSEYLFRTGNSASAVAGADFFVEFVKSVASRPEGYRSLVDVGGNDLYVAKQLKQLARDRAVIDPVCAAIDGQVVDGISVFGRLGEEIDLASDLPTPDILVCRHTLEHVTEPRTMMAQWLEQCSPECLFFIEIPCFENLLESLRLDAIMHQHVQYFDLSTLKWMIWSLGGEYITHRYHHQVSCGGALMVAFRKATKQIEAPLQISVNEKISHIKTRIALFEQQMTVAHGLLEKLPQPAFGFGAGLMLATLGYHLKTDFSGLECILDDDESKHEMQYENVDVRVCSTSVVKPPANSSFVITSLEAMRPIYRRLLDFKPRRILSPLIS